MKEHYQLTKKESEHMSVFICDGRDILNSIFNHLPEHIIRHSQRVAKMCGIISGYVPEHRLPKGIDRATYRAALTKAGYYHEIGIYAARNDVKSRSSAAEKMLTDYCCIDIMPEAHEIVFEAVRSHQERYYGGGYPRALAYEDIPLHANICAIANTVDMLICDGKFDNRVVRKAVNYISQNSGVLFHPDAVCYFEQACEEIFGLYLTPCRYAGGMMMKLLGRKLNKLL